VISTFHPAHAAIAAWTRRPKAETRTLHFKSRYRRVPWPAKLLGAAVAAYASGPAGRLPDFVRGSAARDYVAFVPPGFALAIRSTPDNITDACRARTSDPKVRPTNWMAAAVIVAIGIAAIVLVTLAARRVAA